MSTTDGGGATEMVETRYKTDGSESTNRVQGAPMKTGVKRDGDILTFDSKVNVRG